MASESLTILIIEDSEEDTSLLVRLLRKNNYDPVYRQVWREPALRDALSEKTWDLIVSDFFMPGFSGMDALKIVKQMQPDTPFIVLSGVVGEEKAVEMMLAGADDYVMKDNISRLIPAIKRELIEAQIRRDKKKTEQELEKYRNHLEDLVHERTKELQTVQSELLRKERMALLGQIVATVSHEIANPLGVIRNTTFLINRKLKENDPCREYVDIIEREIDAANRIIANLSETTRSKSPSRQETNLDTLIDEVMVATSIPQGIKFHYQRNPRPYSVNADRMQLKQVMANLINNAIQATGDHGHLIVLANSRQDSDYITVIDTGEGVPEENRSTIFEPLFTTKAKGTGLGLWICKEIIYRHRGDLKVIHHSDLTSRELQLITESLGGAGAEDSIASTMGIGACFQISLPR
jgi:signal transduction histidine kinase